MAQSSVVLCFGAVVAACSAIVRLRIGAVAAVRLAVRVRPFCSVAQSLVVLCFGAVVAACSVIVRLRIGAVAAVRLAVFAIATCSADLFLRLSVPFERWFSSPAPPWLLSL